MDERIDRQESYEGTKPVVDAHRFDEMRLQDFMANHVEGFKGPIEVEQFKGGQSNPTYRITARSGKYVLRRKPPGKLLKSAHAVDREYRVISALKAQEFPVPKPHVLCTDDSVLGTMFYIMDFADGRVVWNPHVPGVSRWLCRTASSCRQTRSRAMAAAQTDHWPRIRRCRDVR